jgi:DNA adenine methylase
LEPTQISPLKRAARMLYLNRTCFNGLYRVNRQGRFNVPIGRYENPVICNTQNLRNVERALTGVELQCWSFETALEFARPGDFFYLDPPTMSGSSGKNDSLTEKEQGRLYEIVRILDRRGCLVMLSNLNTPFTKDLFSNFDQRELRDPRSNSRRTRGRKTQLVIRNYA